MKKSKEGFSLIEMLVVIGIIAVLSGALMMGFGKMSQSAQKAKAQEAVSNAATALALFYQNNGTWGSTLKSVAGENSPRLDEKVAKVLAWGRANPELSRGPNLLGINFSGDEGNNLRLLGTDRFGIVDPWAIEVLKKNPNASLSTRVPSGGTIESHLLYFGIDDDEDGIVELKTAGGEPTRIRATAVVWGAGRDGKLGTKDDVRSWRTAQETSK